MVAFAKQAVVLHVMVCRHLPRSPEQSTVVRHDWFGGLFSKDTGKWWRLACKLANSAPIWVASSGHIHPVVRVSHSPSLSSSAPVIRSALIQAKKKTLEYLRELKSSQRDCLPLDIPKESSDNGPRQEHWMVVIKSIFLFPIPNCKDLVFPMLVFHLEKQVSACALCPWSDSLQAEVQKPHAPLRVPPEG